MRARVLALALLAVFAMPPAARAQAGPARQSAGTRDSTKRDSTKKDTLTMSPPDSVVRAILARRGYMVTRYQGDSVSFNTTVNSLLLYGKPGLVLRDKTRITGDTVTYDDVNKRLEVRGNPGRIKDPAQTNEIVAYAPITYYLDEKRGTAGDVKTAANSGSIWCIGAERGGFASDSGGGTSYGRNATLTTDCSDDPQYYFKVGEYKEVDKRYMVARPAILHIGEVPVMWIPWLFQDMRRGRRGGILTPKFGIADIVRNSPTYRRTLDDMGFYLAPSDYYDAEFWVDWRSGARPTLGDPGWTKFNGDVRYAWLDRFMTGQIAASRQSQDDGSSVTDLTWVHSQKFSQHTSLMINLNYTTSTTILEETAINPSTVVNTIASQANYQTQFGPVNATIGFGQRQYPGRTEIDRDFPNVNLSTKALQLAPWLTWTPTLSSATSQSLHMDSPSQFAYYYVPTATGQLDSALTDRSSRTSTVNFGSPLKVGNFTINSSLNLSDRFNDYPDAKLVIDPADTSIHRTVVYKDTYLTTLDWNLGLNLPQFSQGRWNAAPSITLQNVDPGAYLVRSERTGTKFVSQSKRLVYGIGVSPTLYHRLGGIGPFAALRSSITPVLSYGYSPTASVTDEYLGALGRTRAGYLGAIAQNRVSLGFATVLEGKFRPSADSGSSPAAAALATAPPAAVSGLNPDQGKKIRLLSLQLSSLDYDFERARVTHHSGFATDDATITARSDLLPGLDFGASYSLFDAPSISDSAHFKPYLESVRASLTLGNGAGGLGMLGRAWHWLTGEAAPPPRDTTRHAPGTDTSKAGAAGANGAVGASPQQGYPGSVAGHSESTLRDIPTGQGWQATMSFSLSRPRPPHGSNVISIDPLAQCNQFQQSNPIQYDICVRQQAVLNTDNSQTQTTGGGVVYTVPPQAAVNANLRFNLTENWSAQWTTIYDLERGAFASQILNLQRDIHDWRAIFGFSEAANGAFSFHFLISLKPAPDLKVPFDRTSYGTVR